MDWVMTPYALAMVLVAIVTVTVGVTALRHYRTPGGLPLALLLFAISEYALATGIEFAAMGVPAKIFWSKVEYLGLVYAPVLFLIFALDYARQDRWLTPRHIALLCIIPTLTLLLAITNEWHHLIWTSVTPSPAGNNLVVYGHGIGIWVAAAYDYLIIMVGAVALIRTAIGLPSFYRLQAIIIVVAAVLPFAGNVIYMLDLSPAPGLDLTLISFAITACLLALNIIRFRLFDPMPIARNVLIENMSDAVLVVNAQNRVIDINPAARQLLGRAAASVIGQDISRILPTQRDLVDQFRDVQQTQTEITIDENPPLYLDLRISPLRDWRGNSTGRLIVLRDITTLKKTQDQLRQLSIAVEQSPDSVIITDINGNIEYVNPTFTRLTGYTSEEAIGKNPRILKSGYTPPEAYIRLWQTIKSGNEWRGEFQNKKKNGELDWESAVISPITNEQGVITHFLAVQQNITERKRAEQEIHQLYGETQRYAEQMTALNRISLAITEGLDMARLLPRIHEQCKQIAPIDVFYVALYDAATHQRHVVYFYDRGQYITPPPTDIRIAPGLTGYIIQTRETLFLSDTLDPNQPPPVPLIRTGGRPSRTFVGVPLILRDQVIGVISMQSYQPNAYSQQQIHMLEMIAVQAAIAIQNSQLYEQVQRLAITDELTGLPNRRVLFEKGENEVTRARRFGRPLSVVMIDIDHFKLVNDQFGHAVGDQVLRQIAQAFRQCLRNTDIAARYGGEEFVILLPETDQALATQVAERLRAAVADCYASVGEEQVHVTISLGVAVLDAGTPNFSKLISHADQALYLAKDRGRNRVMVWNGESP